VITTSLFAVCEKQTTETGTQTGTNIMDTLAAQAKNKGGVINSYGMPDVWANYGEIYAEFEKLYGIKHQDIDMGSSVVYSRMKEENASKNDVTDLKPSYAMKLAEEGYTSDYKVSVWDKIPEGQKGVAPNGSVWQAAYKGTLGFIVNTNIVKKFLIHGLNLTTLPIKGL
jgi:putative spermidine/putrescine transport system substrate-binding protein